MRVGNAEWPGQAIEFGPVVKRQEKNRGHLQGVSKECFCIYGFFDTMHQDQDERTSFIVI